MKKFTLTIKENATNEVKIEEQIDAAIGGYANDKKNGCFAAIQSNAFVVAQAIIKAKESIEDVLTENPVVKFAIAMIEAEGEEDDE